MAKKTAKKPAAEKTEGLNLTGRVAELERKANRKSRPIKV